MTTRVITRTRNIIDNVHINNAFSLLSNVHFEGNKVPFKMSYDKHNLTLVVISYELYDIAKGSFHKLHMK